MERGALGREEEAEKCAAGQGNLWVKVEGGGRIFEIKRMSRENVLLPELPFGIRSLSFVFLGSIDQTVVTVLGFLLAKLISNFHGDFTS